MWRSGAVIPTFWWDGHPNFGDDMTPWLLPKYGVLPLHRMPRQAHLAGAGSILEFLPAEYSGAIWGSGLMNEERHPLPEARTLALRGHLTRQLVGARGVVALGDPGILASRHVSRPAMRWDVGLVPHGHHREHADFLALAHMGDSRVKVINVHQPAVRAVREIASCRAIVTTSLHGLVTADSFGIPALWSTLEPPLGGGDFKFRDYESVITPGASRYVEFDPGATVDQLVVAAARAPFETVKRSGDELEAVLAQLPVALGELPRFPRGLTAALR
jgi:hypothetical protein